MPAIKRKFAPSLIAGLVVTVVLAVLRLLGCPLTPDIVLLPALIGIFREVIVVILLYTPIAVSALVLGVYYRMMGTGGVGTAFVDMNRLISRIPTTPNPRTPDDQKKQ